jgi:hypothetical protein
MLAMKNIGWVIAIVAVLAALVAGYFAWDELKDTPGGIGRAEDYKDGTYIIDGEPVTLADGVHEAPAAPGSSSKVTTRYFGNEVKVDLNEDGIMDLAFIITRETGGSGTFFYLVGAIQSDDNLYHGTNAMLVGDRIAPQTTELKDGLIVINYADRKPGEPMSAQPSVGKSMYVKFDEETNSFGEVVQDFEGESAFPVERTVVKIGETKSALGVIVTPSAVISDSRCPLDVTCVWAGTVEVKATMKSGLGTSEQIFTLNEPVTTEAEEVTLLRVDPAPKAGVEIKPAEYVFTFEVKKR